MTETELIALVTREIRTLSSEFVTEDYEAAVDDAEGETGFTLPTSDTFQTYWLKQRTKRHLYFTLLSDSAKQFKFKQFNLQQRFEHYRSLIRDMDREFAEAIEDNPQKFANVSAVQFFGHKIDAGFAYEEGTGRDKTYDDDQLVIVTPLQSD